MPGRTLNLLNLLHDDARSAKNDLAQSDRDRTDLRIFRYWQPEKLRPAKRDQPALGLSTPRGDHSPELPDRGDLVETAAVPDGGLHLRSNRRHVQPPAGQPRP